MDATLRMANNKELLEMLQFAEEAVEEAKAELRAVQLEIRNRGWRAS